MCNLFLFIIIFYILNGMNKNQIKKQLHIGFIGSGNVATHLSLYFKSKGYGINAITGRHLPAVKKMARKINCSVYSDKPEILANSNFIIIAVPDNQLALVAPSLSAVRFTQRTVYLAHTSGSQPSTILHPARKNKSARVLIASLHPMQTFPLPAQNERLYYRSLENIFFGLEGMPAAVTMLKRLLTDTGNNFVILPQDYRKNFYHIGGIIACNFLNALITEILELYRLLKIPDHQTQKIIKPLIDQTIKNIIRYGGPESLTGPAARNDMETIERHINLLKKYMPEWAPSYQALSAACRHIQKKKNVSSE